MANKNAKKALEQFKMQAASEAGVNLNQGYNGDLTARQTGSIGDQMVKNMTPTRLLIFKRPSRIKKGTKSMLNMHFLLWRKGNRILHNSKLYRLITPSHRLQIPHTPRFDEFNTNSICGHFVDDTESSGEPQEDVKCRELFEI